jgi:phosphoribosylanthranilate isomerase
MTEQRDTRTRVKVCGLTRASDARAAVAAGADALGVILVPGARRAVTLEQAAEVLAAAPPSVLRIGVFVDAPAADVREAVERLGLDEVQFSGDETPEACAAAPVPVIKAFHVGPGFSLEQVVPYQGAIAAALLDTAASGERGGTGQVFDWSIVTTMCVGVPVILAGGLNPGNVGEAIAVARPFAVDVSSGVEAALREKDPVLIEEFIAAVRSADATATDMKDE